MLWSNLQRSRNFVGSFVEHDCDRAVVFSGAQPRHFLERVVHRGERLE